MQTYYIQHRTRIANRRATRFSEHRYHFETDQGSFYPKGQGGHLYLDLYPILIP